MPSGMVLYYSHVFAIGGLLIGVWSLAGEEVSGARSPELVVGIRRSRVRRSGNSPRHKRIKEVTKAMIKYKAFKLSKNQSVKR